MKESKFLEGVRTAIIKIVTYLFLSTCAVSFDAESEVVMVTSNSETLTYSNASLNFNLATDSSLPYLHDRYYSFLTHSVTVIVFS